MNDGGGLSSEDIIKREQDAGFSPFFFILSIFIFIFAVEYTRITRWNYRAA